MNIKKRKILIIENEEKFYKEVTNAIQEKLGDWFDIYPKLKEERGTINNFQHLLEDFLELGKYDEIIDHYKETDFYVIDISLIKGPTDGYDIVEKIQSKQAKQEVKYVMISSLKNQEKCIWKGETDWTGLVAKEILKAFPDIAKEKEKSLPSEKSDTIFDRIYTEYKDSGTWSAINLVFRFANKITRGIIHLGITLVFYFLLVLTTIYAAANMYHEFWPVIAEQPANVTSPAQVNEGKQGESKFINTANPAINDDLSQIKPSTNQTKSTSPNQAQASTTTNQTHTANPQITNAAEKNVLEHAEKIFLYLLPLFIVFGFYIYYFTNTRIYFNDGRLSELDRETSMHAMNFTKTIFVSSLISYTLIETVDEIFTVRLMGNKFLIAAGALLIILIGYFILLSSHNGTGHKTNNNKE